MSDRESKGPPSSRDLAGEDFLFHLYRGSEMLQDERVHDAKAELEQALALQPRDPKGQDLLAIVYFRLGLYPRAITIYEQLTRTHPEATTPRVNLALCYLKTGQAAHARAELEKVVARNPDHSRAWGYLGLAFQRLGDLEKASHAFSAGGHDAMARRLLETSTTMASASLRPEALPQERIEVRRAAGTSSPEELLPPRAAESPEAGPETARAPLTGDVALPPPTPLPSVSLAGDVVARAAPTQGPPPFVTDAPRSRDLSQVSAPLEASLFARERLLIFPRDRSVVLHASGVVLVQTTTSFASRLDVLRSIHFTSSVVANLLSRRTRGRTTDEPLGGAASPLFELEGRGELVLAPSAGRKLHPIALVEEALYLREDILVAFETALTYESGRLAVGDGDAIAMVQLRGQGTAVASFHEPVQSIEVTPDRSVALRALSVVGWVGRMVPRALSPSEAPAGARGFIAFSGEGMVLLDGR